MTEYLVGFLSGGSVVLMIAIYWQRLDHKHWLALCSRYEALIEELQRKKDDDAPA